MPQMHRGHPKPKGKEAILDENIAFFSAYKAVRMRQLLQALVRVWLIRHTQCFRCIGFTWRRLALPAKHLHVLYIQHSVLPRPAA